MFDLVGLGSENAGFDAIPDRDRSLVGRNVGIGIALVGARRWHAYFDRCNGKQLVAVFPGSIKNDDGSETTAVLLKGAGKALAQLLMWLELPVGGVEK